MNDEYSRGKVFGVVSVGRDYHGVVEGSIINLEFLEPSMIVGSFRRGLVLYDIGLSVVAHYNHHESVSWMEVWKEKESVVFIDVKFNIVIMSIGVNEEENVKKKVLSVSKIVKMGVDDHFPKIFKTFSDNQLIIGTMKQPDYTSGEGKIIHMNIETEIGTEIYDNRGGIRAIRVSDGEEKRVYFGGGLRGESGGDNDITMLQLREERTTGDIYITDEKKYIGMEGYVHDIHLLKVPDNCQLKTLVVGAERFAITLFWRKSGTVFRRIDECGVKCFTLSGTDTFLLVGGNRPTHGGVVFLKIPEYRSERVNISPVKHCARLCFVKKTNMLLIACPSAYTCSVAMRLLIHHPDYDWMKRIGDTNEMIEDMISIRMKEKSIRIPKIFFRSF